MEKFAAQLAQQDEQLAHNADTSDIGKAIGSMQSLFKDGLKSHAAEVEKIMAYVQTTNSASQTAMSAHIKDTKCELMDLVERQTVIVEDLQLRVSRSRAACPPPGGRKTQALVSTCRHPTERQSTRLSMA